MATRYPRVSWHMLSLPPFPATCRGAGKNPGVPHRGSPVSHCEGAKVGAEVNPHLKRR